jgi:hypothetical protein
VRTPARPIALALALTAVAIARGASAGPGSEGGDGSFETDAPVPAAPPAAPPAKRSGHVVGFRADGGYAARRVVRLPTEGADLGVAFGVQPFRYFAFWGATRLFLGSTDGGLGVWAWRLGPDFDVVLDRFRIGWGVNVFVLGVRRAVRDETITTWGPAGHFGARLDVFQAESFALFLRGDVDAGAVTATRSVFWGGTIGAGVDFDIHGVRTEENGLR